VLPTDRQTDGRATAYSKREREFTFAKNQITLRYSWFEAGSKLVADRFEAKFH